MKRYATTITFSMIALSIVAGAAVAEAKPKHFIRKVAEVVPVETPEVQVEVDEESIQQGADLSKVSGPQVTTPLPAQVLNTQASATASTVPSSQAVSAPTISAVPVPQAAAQSTVQGSAVPSIPANPTAGNGSSNLNHGGTQNIFNIMPAQSQQATQDTKVGQNAEQSVNDPLNDIRLERARQEGRTEGMTLRKLEDGRLKDEGNRQRMIEPLDFSSEGASTSIRQTQEIEVAPAVAPVAIGARQEIATSVNSSDSASRDSSFSLSPVIGYRWYQNNNYMFKAQNQYLTGVQMSGEVNKYMGLEASFTYGRDNLRPNYIYNGNYYAPQQYNNNYSSYGNYNYGYGQMVTVRTRDSYEFGGALKLGYSASMVRPYALIGLTHVTQRYNIDDGATKAYAESIGWTRSTTNMAANYGAGLDVKLDRYLAVGARFDYQYTINRKASYMHDLYGDQDNRMRVMGTIQLVF